MNAYIKVWTDHEDGVLVESDDEAETVRHLFVVGDAPRNAHESYAPSKRIACELAYRYAAAEAARLGCDWGSN